MVIWPAFGMWQYRANDHPYHASQFMTYTTPMKAFDDDRTYRGLPLASDDENLRGLTHRTIDFLTNNEPKRWVFPTIMPRLNETNEEDLAFVTKARFQIDG